MSEIGDILAGNISSLCAMVTDSVSSTRKSQKGILFFQTLSQVFYMTSYIILKGYSSAVQCAVGILRNIVAMWKIKSRIIEWILVALGVGLGLVFNNLGLLGWLPVVANLEYTLAVFRFKENPRALKIAFLINMLMYTVFNAIILNIVGAVASLIVATTTTVFLIKDKKNNSKPGETPEPSEQLSSLDD